MESFLRYILRWPSMERLVADHLWVWGMCQSLHFVGMCLLLGAVGILDLRLLGMVKELPIGAVKRLVPWGVFGFALTLASGFVFVGGIYSNVGIHPYVVLMSDVYLQWKLIFVILAGINLLAFYVTGMARTVEALGPGADAPPLAKIFAGTSLFLWIGVMFFARLIPAGKFQP